MNIPFDPNTESDMIELQEQFNQLGESALSYTHYELYNVTGILPEVWIKFLTDSRVSEAINKENDLLRDIKLRKSLADLDTNSKSPGAAQVFNALTKATEKESTAPDGPIFIYSYIPLSKEERTADNVKTVHKDPFIVHEDTTIKEPEPQQVDVDITSSNEYL